MADGPGTSLEHLLRATSRSFYLTLRVLPASVRPQIGLAYLLARTTDTIADTELIPVIKRLQALDEFRGRILGTWSNPVVFSKFAEAQPAQPNHKLGAEELLL